MPEGKIVTETRKLYRTDVEELGRTSARWWLAKDDDLWKSVLPVTTQIEASLSARRAEWIKYGRLYAGRDFRGFGPGAYGPRPRGVLDRDQRLTLNVVRSCIATAAAKIASKKPRCQFLGIGAGYELKQKGKALTKYVDGIFTEANVYSIARDVFVDACVFGLGSLKIFARHGRIQVERVMIDETLLDEEDGRYGTPRQRHQRKYVSREELLEQFGSSEDAVAAIKKATTVEAVGAHRTVAERIAVYESWHLASGPDASDGKHCLSIDGFTLFAEPYKHPWFPIVDLTWENDLYSPFGTGLAEQLVGIQVEINRVLRQVSKSIEMSVPRAFLNTASKVAPGSLTDEIWSIVRYTGQPPTFNVPAAVSGETLQHLANLYGKAFEITGVSQAQAASQKPAGLDSGVALREYNDQTSERFLCTGQRWEEFFLRIARIVIELSRDLAKEDPKFSVKIKDGKKGRDLKWLDIDLDEDEYLMQPFPVAFLPSTPAGKLAYVQDMLKSGLIQDRQRILQLLDFPDTEEWLGVEVAGLSYVQRAISRILDKGVYIEPNKYMPLDLAVPLAQAAWLEGEDDERPQDRLDLLAQWADACADLAESLKPPAPPMAPNGAPPMGPPAAPPMAA